MFSLGMQIVVMEQQNKKKNDPTLSWLLSVWTELNSYMAIVRF